MFSIGNGANPICAHKRVADDFAFCPDCGKPTSDMSIRKQIFALVKENEDKDFRAYCEAGKKINDLCKELKNKPVIYVRSDEIAQVLTKSEVEEAFPILRLFKRWDNGLSETLNVFALEINEGDIILGYSGGATINLTELNELDLKKLGPISANGLVELLEKHLRIDDVDEAIDELKEKDD